VVFVKHSNGIVALFKSGSSVLTVLGAFCAFLAVGCGRSTDTAENLYRIPWPGEDGKYSLQAVPLTGFDQPDTLQGRYVQIFVNPYARNGQIASHTPIGRFVRSKEGVLVPADYTSLQAAVVHAHFERFHRMNQELGVELNWPVKVGIRSQVKDRWGVIRNNAIFDGRLDTLLLVPFVSKKGLPIALNAGILAHEHFHMIFQHSVLKRVRFKRKERLEVGGKFSEWSSGHEELSSEAKTMAAEEDPSLYASLFNEFNMRALNEGLADFWGWVYTGDPDFIRHSLPSESPYRRLDVKVKSLLGREWIKGMVFNQVTEKPYSEQILGENIYQLGSTYARVLHELATATSEDEGRSFESRLKFARTVVKSLPSFARATMKAEASGDYVSPNTFLRAIYENWPVRDDSVCKLFKRIAAADEDSFSDELQCSSAEE